MGSSPLWSPVTPGLRHLRSEARRAAAAGCRPCLGGTVSFAAAGLLVALAASPPAPAMPEQVLLLRHGHKDGVASNYNLSPQGFARAIALAGLLPRCFGTPSRIRTFYLDPVSSKNARSYQTAVPLAVATGVNIAIDLASREDSRSVGRRILEDPGFDRARVVLFWEHRRMPELAAGLGWPSLPPIADDDFDQLIVMRYRPPSPVPEVRLFSQSRLLEGRQRCPSAATASGP